MKRISGIFGVVLLLSISVYYTNTLSADQDPLDQDDHHTDLGDRTDPTNTGVSYVEDTEFEVEVDQSDAFDEIPEVIELDGDDLRFEEETYSDQ